MKNKIKFSPYIIGLVIVIFAVLFFSFFYESSKDIKKNVESTVNELTIDYASQLKILNQRLTDLERTALGQTYVSSDKRYIVIDTIPSGIQDYDNIKTFLFDFREGKVIELEGRIASWTGNSIWILNYKTKLATWYTLVSGSPEYIASFSIGEDEAYHFSVSPNEEYTVISGEGIRVISKKGSIEILSIDPYASAHVWKGDNETILGVIPNPEREILPEEKLYGPLDNLLVSFNRRGGKPKVLSPNVTLSSPRELEWINQDTSLLVNSGFDDGSFDSIVLFKSDQEEVKSLGETSGAMEGRTVDTETHSFIVIGEFYPKDFNFDINNNSGVELKIYNEKGELDYQYAFADETYVNFSNVQREGNIIWFVAQQAGDISNYRIGSLDIRTDTLSFNPEISSDSHMSFKVLHNNSLLLQRGTQLEIVSILTGTNSTKNL